MLYFKVVDLKHTSSFFRLLPKENLSVKIWCESDYKNVDLNKHGNKAVVCNISKPTHYTTTSTMHCQ